MIEQHKQLSAIVVHQIYNQAQFEQIELIFHPQYVQKPLGYNGFKGVERHVNEVHSVFSGLNLSLIDQIAEADGVVNLVLFNGTHTGQLWEFAPTQRQASVMLILIHRFVEGKIVEAIFNLDQLGLLQQLKLLPTPIWAKPN
ncbi:ester cyclase [Herpetosiphon gulosus]|uniref:Ester cyclase n=1 Tax=Herpetosiphon gulosus TaxID=1973496 RepID=A0ABP9X3W6_9CHLR